MERTKVVVHYLDGKLTKGYTLDFYPNKDRFHITLFDKPRDAPIEVAVNQLKAVFVVKDFRGNPQYIERKGYTPGETPYGAQLEVTFGDGEIVVGACMGFDVKRQGFFITPVDPKGNNLRAFVVMSSVRRLRQFAANNKEYVEVPLPPVRRTA